MTLPLYPALLLAADWNESGSLVCHLPAEKSREGGRLGKAGGGWGRQRAALSSAERGQGCMQQAVFSQHILPVQARGAVLYAGTGMLPTYGSQLRRAGTPSAAVHKHSQGMPSIL